MRARHVQKSSSERTTAIAILVIGTLVVIASQFGGIWVVRAGAAAAVLMAFAAVAVAWRELERERNEHRAELKRQVALRIERAEQHHADSVAMIERYDERANLLTNQIDGLRRQLGAARAELSSLRGNNVWLRGEVAERQARVDELTARIAELEALVADEQNVVNLPTPLSPTVDDIWGDEEHPTLVDLAKLTLEDTEEPLRREA